MSVHLPPPWKLNNPQYCKVCSLPKKMIIKDKDGDPRRVCGNRKCDNFKK